jgi:hypothetical protein
MREPTEAMLDHYSSDRVVQWQLMIDAALANLSEIPNSSESAE